MDIGKGNIVYECFLLERTGSRAKEIATGVHCTLVIINSTDESKVKHRHVIFIT